VPFMYSTMLVAIPTGVKFFSWVATLWEGKIRLTVPMMFTLGAISVFLLGGLSGPPNGTVSTDLHLHDTYWIVGHFHATMFGGFIFPFVAAVYYWFPKMTGRRMNDTIGKIQFWLLTPGFWLQSLGMMRVGLLGMRRRIFTYDPALGLDTTHLAISIAGFMVGLSVLLFIINIVRSVRHGEVAVGNVWESRSLEWQIPSPAPDHNYVGQTVTVVGEPYDYGLPGSRYITTQVASATAPAE
jgi:cytochrome c oxidase subunit I